MRRVSELAEETLFTARRFNCWSKRAPTRENVHWIKGSVASRQLSMTRSVKRQTPSRTCCEIEIEKQSKKAWLQRNQANGTLQQNLSTLTFSLGGKRHAAKTSNFTKKNQQQHFSIVSFSTAAKSMPTWKSKVLNIVCSSSLSFAKPLPAPLSIASKQTSKWKQMVNG